MISLYYKVDIRRLRWQKKKRKRIIKAKSHNLKSLDQFIDEKVGRQGFEDQEQFENEYEAFKLGITIVWKNT